MGTGSPGDPIQPPAAPGPVAPAPAAWPPAPVAPAPAVPVAPAPSPAAASSSRDDDGGHRGVALLLALTAVLAAIIGARSTALASNAGDDWQSALRIEVKRSTAAMSDIHLLYQSEIPSGVNVMRLRLVEAETRTAAASASGVNAVVLTEEADTAKGVLTAIEPSIELAKPDYALPNGGMDTGKRLAAMRAENADLTNLDPDVAQLQGDDLGMKASWMTLGLVPLGFAALFGALAQPFWHHRRTLLFLGGASLVAGALVAGIVEVLA